MNRSGRLLASFLLIFMTANILISCNREGIYTSIEDPVTVSPIKVSVFEYRDDDDYISAVSRDLRKIQEANEGKVQFTFYDSKNSQQLQNENINRAIEAGTDLLLVNLVDVTEGQTVVNRIKENNLPVVLYNREPITHTPIKSYNKAVYIGNDSREGGILQGEILVELWNTKKDAIDRNRDGVMQYIMLSGGLDNIEAAGRTKYSIDTVQNAGIKTEELGLRVASWDENLAKRATESLFFRYGNAIEVVVANDDTMAIGAIKALQELGYNKEGGIRTIPVIGFDAEAGARQLIEQGIMTGSVIQSTYAIANALYSVGMNLAYEKNPLEGTPYVFDSTGVSIRIPYEGVIVNFSGI